MNLIARPSVLSGTVTAPASKSHMQRLIASALLANGESWIRNPSDASDAWAALSAAAGLGAEAEVGETAIRMVGGLKPRSQELNLGESGLGIRMFAPIAALVSHPIALVAEGTLQQRPMTPLADALGRIGVKVELTQGHAPILLEGPLQGGDLELDGTLSSQFLTGLLMALPCAQKDSTITVHGLQSRPYIDMTLDVLSSVGIQVTHEDHRLFRIPGNQQHQPFDQTVSGDWSAGAFLLVLGRTHRRPLTSK